MRAVSVENHGIRGTLRHEARLGEHFDNAIAQVIAKANTQGRSVEMEFNGIRFVAVPGDTYADAVAARTAHHDSPEYKQKIAESKARGEKEKAARDVREHAKVDSANARPARSGAELFKALKAEAQSEGYGSWEFYAVCNLRSAGEIQEFTSHYHSQYPQHAAENIRFCLGDRTAPFTDDFWRSALRSIESGSTASLGFDAR